jgi:hypothetical protein
MAIELIHYSCDIVPTYEMPDNKLFSLVVIRRRLMRCYRSYDLLLFATGTHDMPLALPHVTGTRVEVVLASGR